MELVVHVLIMHEIEGKLFAECHKDESVSWIIIGNMSWIELLIEFGIYYFCLESKWSVENLWNGVCPSYIQVKI